jgi:Tfp pilus assembly protein PilO
MKKRFVSLAAVSALVTLGWFVFAFRPAQSRLGALNDDVETTRQEVATLQARLEKLLQLQRNAPEVRAEAGRMATALPKEEPRVQDVVLQIQDAANSAGIDFLTITPSLPAVPPEAAAAGTVPTTPTQAQGSTATPAPTATPAQAAAAAAARAADPVAKLRSIDMQIKAEGQFFEMEQFVLRLEQLARALRIDDLSLTTVDQAGGARVGAAMKVRIFMLAPQAAVAAAAPSTQATSGS